LIKTDASSKISPIHHHCNHGDLENKCGISSLGNAWIVVYSQSSTSLQQIILVQSL